MNNHDVFSDSLEAKKWAQLGDSPLSAIEDHLVHKYLTNKRGRVLEAGCGSGRISFNLEAEGFEDIQAFDFSQLMVTKAEENKAPRESEVEFFQKDASELTNLPSCTYDYLIYLEQVICFVPPDRIDDALSEANRVLKTGGTAIFSFLDYRKLSVRHMCRLGTLRLLRFFRNETIPNQSLPWVKLGEEMNRSFYSKGQSCNYWFRREEFLSRLERTGFCVVEVCDDGLSRSSFVVGRK